MYRFRHIYEYDKILAIIMNSINKNNIELFDKKYLDIALIEQLMPKTDNDFNNFNDVIFDKYNKSGYLIQRGKYYIFQPNDEKANVPYYYRKKFDIKMKNLVSINNYTKTNFKHIDKKKENKIIDDKKNYLEFDSTLKYYDNRDENIIIRDVMRKSKNKSNSLWLFKIRPSRNREKKKKRYRYLFSNRGNIRQYKDKQYLIDALKNMKPHINETDKKFKKTRDNCNL